MIGLNNWILLKVIFMSLFAKRIFKASAFVDEKSDTISKESICFSLGGKFYIVELTIMKDLEQVK